MAGERFRVEMFESLTRKNAVYCFPPSEVELNDVLSAIGNIVGLHNIRAASRMNKKFSQTPINQRLKLGINKEHRRSE